ncbi:hypothetical protein [Desulfosporosinus meridiei]|uniref:Uncharacterized protein n=1 Tax=Desulfosporosinus meridiei (strain ATCC BAA-275 / DSM 13257 / KCTC 12902 / NCIMB 13706 / S10) TaxID=768704 RepID=J7J438_DESMD|nr:hypothetical protein [Desulfosporosinus meridiei]AFQ45721.1 hypothetical protein Desmer_3885 [Desulfosporosinus meridiei DSM 13257]
MADYYGYLWSTTWPNLGVLFLIIGVILSRLVWKFVTTWRNARHVWGFLLLSLKMVIWVGVLGVYTQLLLFSQPDWFAKPGLIEGTVQGKSFDTASNIYSVDIRSGTDQTKLFIDFFVYQRLNIDDHVKLMYLPIRREVIRCEIVSSLL